MDEAKDSGLTRIQRRNREIILEGALTVFAVNGFRGTTIDQIAAECGLSKPNVLYYFPSKDEIHKTLLTKLLDMWLAPLENIEPEGEALQEVLDYVAAKLRMSREYPRESRLFAYEILRGAPHLTEILGGRLRNTVDDAVAVLRGWTEAGKLRNVDPHHLIFSIWSMTQHYADFEVQVRAVLGEGHDPFSEAEIFLEDMYRRLLTP
ncbi:TetR family transcriptional regulator [Paracoccus onubensis]|uniref:TetR family transcriptional regulator n=2 Tax=Paracoccus onubensis TaxID=1675788 RepID=A0A418SRD8_9RHOB|nr:TetR family transcriptional regulator C-terminal domain-containing protein [Paracoccus onubensis]RJE83524.1 TetR family transcriptional regulator [Paracoccus onubensis]